MRYLGLIGAAITLLSVSGAHADTISASCGQSKLNGSITTCDGTATASFQSEGPDVDYMVVIKASPQHCSKVRYSVLSQDGAVNFGQTKFLDAGRTGIVKIGNGFAAGLQVFTVKADGKVGGCNSGAMSGWVADVTVEAE